MIAYTKKEMITMTNKIKIENNSEKLKLNTTDGKKLMVGLGVALGGAALTWLAQTIPMIEFGEWTPLAVAISGVIVNVGRKLLAGKK